MAHVRLRSDPHNLTQLYVGDPRANVGGAMQRIRSWGETRSAPIVVTIAMVIGGFAYLVCWNMLSHRGWVGVSDLWNSTSVSLAISQGHWSAVYTAMPKVITPPGLEVVLAPVVALGHALGLHPPHRGTNTGGTLGVVVVPTATILASTVLFAIDAVARSWHFSEAKRVALALVAGLGVVSAVVFWGHPEDCVALALVIWAALVVDREGSSGLARAGWLLGIAVAFQPLALLGVTPILARCAWRSLPAQAVRLALPSAALVLLPLLASPHQTLRALMAQPYFPVAESYTPFGNLAPHLGDGLRGGGPMRLFVTLAAVLLGYAACRRRHDLPLVLLAIALACALRVFFETELLGFYFFPVTAICLLLALRRSWRDFGVCSAAAVACIALGNRREHSIALWWPAIMATAVLALVVVTVPIVTEYRASAQLRLPPGSATPTRWSRLRTTHGAGVGI
jgi:hypothetical protein